MMGVSPMLRQAEVTHMVPRPRLHLKQELSTFSGRRSGGQVIEREAANTALVDHTTSFSIPRGKTLGVVGESC